jgi:hypothetical protein
VRSFQAEGKASSLISSLGAEFIPGLGKAFGRENEEARDRRKADA